MWKNGVMDSEENRIESMMTIFNSLFVKNKTTNSENVKYCACSFYIRKLMMKTICEI